MKKRYLVFGAVAFGLLTGVPGARADDFDDGLASRTQWETFLNGLFGDQRDGAVYWAGQRSQPRPGQCSGSPEFSTGCNSARGMLAPADQRRRSSQDFRRGWNSFQAEAAAAPISPPTDAGTPALSVEPQRARPSADVSGWEQVLPTVKANCARQWADDFRMQAYCIKKQHEGFDDLHAADASPGPAPQAVRPTTQRDAAPLPSDDARVATTGSLGADAIGRMVTVNRSNELQFTRDFKGRGFLAVGRFKSATEALIGSGARVGFDAQNGQSFDCQITAAQKAMVADWPIGKAMSVSGTISGTVMGDLQLGDCQFGPS